MRTKEELAFKGERISLTFRHIGTFTNTETNTIWGQGARSKIKEKAGRVIHGDPTETDRMIHAFGKENHQTDFNWDEYYGQGFDVVNFVTTMPATLFGSHDELADFCVRMCLIENGIRYNWADLDEVSPSIRDALTLQHTDGGAVGPVLVDPDGVTYISGDLEILLHVAELQQQERPPEPFDSRTQTPSRTLRERLRTIEELLSVWRAYQKVNSPGDFPDQLSAFEAELSGKPYLAGQAFGIEDCALWPVMRDIVRSQGSLVASRFPSLSLYYQRVGRRGCVKVVLDELQVGS
jgi:glutathione S-transferase